MKRKFLRLFLAFCLLVGLMPMTVFATEPHVASETIGGTTTNYSDLQAAIDAAEAGGTSGSPAVLKLLADIPYTEVDNPDYGRYPDIEMPEKIPATWTFGGYNESIKYVNLDMNGHSVSNRVELWGTVMTIFGNGTFNGTASINNTDGCLCLRPLSKVTIENGTFNNAINMSTGSVNLTELTINGGTFSNGAYYSTVEVFGAVFINGGNFTADSTRMFNLNKGSLTIAGGNFACSTGVNLVYIQDSFNWHPTLSMSGGTFTNGITVNVAQSDGKLSYKLKAILAEKNGYFDTDGNQITSGLDGYAISSSVAVKEKVKLYPYVNAHGVAQTPVAATVLSGTINENIGVSGQETWYIVTESATIAQYKKFIGTVNLILADGATLTSLMTGTSGADDTLIIWGQEKGNGIFNATAQAWEAGIQLAGGTLIINGVTINATGCTTPDYAVNGAIGENFKSITINGGTVNATATKGPAIGSGSNSPIIITGGKITLNSPIIGIQTGDSGSVTVTGGTIANQSGGKVAIKSGVVSADENCFTDGVNITGHVHSWSADWSSSDTEHWYECSVCHAEKPDSREAHKGGTATCTAKAKCSICDVEYGTVDKQNHSKSSFIYTDNKDGKTHTKKYDCCCAEVSENHSYGDDHICDLCSYADIKDYATTTGAKQEVTKGNDVTFKSNAEFAKFIKVQVDGKDVDSKYYTAESGSTKITLKKEFIDTLSVGEHILSIVSTDGKATTSFTVKAKAVVSDNTTEPDNTTKPENNKIPDTEANAPKTGDSNNMVLWIGLMLASVVVLTNIVLFRKKRQTR